MQKSNNLVISSNIKALIFDMDGTLVNSEPVGPDTFAQLAKKYGVNPSENELNTFLQSWKRIGDYKSEQIVLTDFANIHNLPTNPDDFIKEFFELYLLNLPSAPALSGVTEFLNKAKNQGYKTAIVSASKTRQIETIIAVHNWQGIFDFIIGEEDIAKHKPDPEGYQKAINKIGQPACNCAIFEDAKNGVIAAKAAGAFVVGLREGNSELIDLGSADSIVNSFLEISL